MQLQEELKSCDNVSQFNFPEFTRLLGKMKLYVEEITIDFDAKNNFIKMHDQIGQLKKENASLLSENAEQKKKLARIYSPKQEFTISKNTTEILLVPLSPSRQSRYGTTIATFFFAILICLPHKKTN